MMHLTEVLLFKILLIQFLWVFGKNKKKTKSHDFSQAVKRDALGIAILLGSRTHILTGCPHGLSEEDQIYPFQGRWGVDRPETVM